MTDREKLAIVIVAAGSGHRFGADKMTETLGDRSVLETTVEAVRAVLPSAPVVVVVTPDKVKDWRAVLESVSAEIEVITGGTRRQDSVRLGVERAAEWGAEVVAIHDGARPAVHPDDIVAVVRAVDEKDGALLSARVSDTVKRIEENGTVIETIDRDRLRFAQTPQVFRVTALEDAWAACDLDREWSDEAAMLEAAGLNVHTVAARHPNPKITTAADLELVRILCGDGS